jgi:hypothetical protein
VTCFTLHGECRPRARASLAYRGSGRVLRRLIESPGVVTRELRSPVWRLVTFLLGLRRLPVPARGDRGGGPTQRRRPGDRTVRCSRRRSRGWTTRPASRRRRACRRFQDRLVMLILPALIVPDSMVMLLRRLRCAPGWPAVHSRSCRSISSACCTPVVAAGDY